MLPGRWEGEKGGTCVVWTSLSLYWHIYLSIESELSRGVGFFSGCRDDAHDMT